MIQINAYAAPSEKAPFAPFTYEADDPTAFEAEVAISHCGVCHSDLHIADGDWNPREFPVVPGHEIIGTVTAVASQGDPSLVGQRVGIGWQRGSCLNCAYCNTGQEHLCAQSVATCSHNYGGFAEKIIVDSRFLHPIPDDLPSETAAPLLCAGITVYSPLQRYATHTSRVGIIGIGGLGHLALQFANKMGCHVTAFSSGDSKRDEAQQLGAHHYVNGRDDDALKAQRRSLDLIISTPPANLDWARYIGALKPNGVLCFVGAPSQTVNVQINHILQNKAVAGSVIGGRQMMRDMLSFAARQGIESWSEVLPFDSINEAMTRLRENEVRYRFVLAR